MKINCYAMCEKCPYAEYIGLGQVGCYGDNPPCLKTMNAVEETNDEKDSEDCV